MSIRRETLLVPLGILKGCKIIARGKGAIATAAPG